jgi:hypothetical protein
MTDFGFGIAECGFGIEETGDRIHLQIVDFGLRISDWSKRRAQDEAGTSCHLPSASLGHYAALSLGIEHRAGCGSEVSNEKVGIKVCNTYFPKQKGRVILNPAFSKIVNSSYALIINSLLEQCR